MKKILAIGFLLLLGWSAYSLWLARAVSPVDAGSATRTTVTIESGWPLARIADTLEERGLLRSSFAFTRLVKREDLDASLQAGDYVLSPSMSAAEIAESLTSGKSDEEKITVPEGFTVAQIDALLAERGFGEPGDILDCAFTCDFSSFEFLPTRNFGSEEAGYGSKLEGYLFPDTYFVARENYVPKFFLERMLSAFRTRVVTGLADDIAASGRELHELVTMASLVERETRTDDERAVVSGIIWKRFDAGMGLDIDATVRYVTRNVSDPITRTELETDSPYNTRRYRGLPPGAIANAGIDSVRAALHPETSPYWYYLHGTDGQIRYAETNDAHNENKARYLR